jgi:hypothetical protein
MTLKITAARRERILELLRAGNSRQAASRAVGIDRLTFRRWMLRGAKFPGGLYKEFREAVLAAEETARKAPRPVALRTELERIEADPEYALRWLIRKGEFDHE